MPGGAGGRISAGVGANLLGMHAADRNQEATVYVGNVDPQGSEELIWELFVQAGPVGEPTTRAWELARAPGAARSLSAAAGGPHPSQ